jgi:hypothetical protein
MHDYQTIAEARAHGVQVAANNSVTYGGQPYSVHLDAVVLVLFSHGLDDLDLVCLGYLHDAVEDAKSPKDEAECLDQWASTMPDLDSDIFTDTLSALTHQRGVTRSIYLNNCFRSPRAAVVKVADRIANVESCLARPLTSDLARIGLKYVKEWPQLRELATLHQVSDDHNGLIPPCMASRLTHCHAQLGAAVADFYAAEALKHFAELERRTPDDCPF